MKKNLLILTIPLLIVLIASILYLISAKTATPNPGVTTSTCANQGESFTTIPEPSLDTEIIYPAKCCEGLIDVGSTSLCINNQLYSIAQTSELSKIGTCSNCGNNLCDEVENSCTCPKDCFNTKMDFTTIEEFCQRESGYEYYCTDLAGFPLPTPPLLCSLCKNK